MSPALTHLATRLSDRFETRVKVDLGQKRGKIVVEFASIEDLERILGAMAPGEGDDDLIGVAIDHQVRVVSDDDDLTPLASGSKSPDKLYEDRARIQVLFGLIDD